LTKDDVDRWLQDYVGAWKSYDRDEIAALFSDDISYRFQPYEEPPTVGRDAVVEVWLGEGHAEGASTRDEPGTYDAEYHCVAVDGDVAVARGSSTYYTERGGPVDKVYDNCYLMRFDSDGRCSEFTEFYMERPKA
jgi:ketosteroid isomerase-like protein